ncbi:MAG: N-acetyl-gamma-glutamyl-phosphate reductase [Oscillospiraceae bacterium]|nr:N-acetyl-gamma-glutamyl-phosphate reductase [Oscillospiraceae bacterium]
MTKVFIDGSAGTTGLRIYERLSDRADLELIKLPEELRKDTNARRDALNKCDVAFLCLPDAAAVEAVELIENDKTVVIDTSTAHRTNPDWTYGFAEIAGLRQKIKKSKRIANPGCHASGFVALVSPLVEKGVLSKDARLSCTSLTGYSGGGKNMIADYENEENAKALLAPRMYALSQQHKHLKEMAIISGLKSQPIFCPIVSSFYSGMQVTVPLFKEDVNISLNEIKELYKEYYQNGLVKFVEGGDENGFMSASKMSLRDDMEISVLGNDERIVLVSRFDNLGKGASGAAIQNMNILLGLDEKTGLNI